MLRFSLHGSFGSFRWPTTYYFPNVLGLILAPTAQLNSFDDSDLRSWQSGLALSRLLTRLNKRHPGQVRLFAHSHGNIAVAEALRLVPPNTVQVYLAMQAAVAAHDYAASAPLRTLRFGDEGTPNLHANYSGPGIPYLNGVNGAASFINFYNPVDWALAFWEIDQDLKPAETRHYGFQAGVFYLTNSFGFVRTLTIPADTFELFAYCVESRCFAVGQQAGLGGAFNADNEVLLDPTFNFGDHHKGHSAEFLSNNMQRAPFWLEVMRSFNLAPRPQ